MSANHKNSAVYALEPWRRKLLELEAEADAELKREATSSGAEGEEEKDMESNRRAES